MNVSTYVDLFVLALLAVTWAYMWHLRDQLKVTDHYAENTRQIIIDHLPADSSQCPGSEEKKP